MTHKLPISVVVIACNEAKNLSRCLKSVQNWVSEIVVVINDCTDNTQQVAESFNARVIEHTWEGYAAQKNFAHSCASNDWILSLDADEEISEKLKQSIIEFFKTSDINTYVAITSQRTNRYLNRWLHHAAKEKHHWILLKKSNVRWEGIVHEKLNFEGKTKSINGTVLHYTETSVQQTLYKQIKYAKLSAIRLHTQHSKLCILVKAILNPWASFIKNYLFHGGFLDGFVGFYYSTITAYYTFLKYIFAFELKNNG